VDEKRAGKRHPPFALGLKNALFSGHDEGRHARALFASLMATFRFKGVNRGNICQPLSCSQQTSKPCSANLNQEARFTPSSHFMA
jgi:hypothetical protein